MIPAFLALMSVLESNAPSQARFAALVRAGKRKRGDDTVHRLVREIEAVETRERKKRKKRKKRDPAPSLLERLKLVTQPPGGAPTPTPREAPRSESPRKRKSERSKFKGFARFLNQPSSKPKGKGKKSKGFGRFLPTTLKRKKKSKGFGRFVPTIERKKRRKAVERESDDGERAKRAAVMERKRKGARALYNYVTEQETRPRRWGHRGKPNEKIRTAQAAMKRIEADGIYGPKTRARGKKLIGESFPTRRSG